jgi:acetyl-CoA synthetase
VEQINGRLAAHQPQLLITADGTYQAGQTIPLKRLADAALAGLDSIQTLICVRHTGQPVAILPEKDHWYHDLMNTAAPDSTTEFMDAEDPLFIYYAGETADAILHTHGGYMVGTATTLKWVFDIRPEDVYWCTADPATITGHSYLLYAPFLLGATTFLYEGSPSHPHPERWPNIMNRYGISLLYSDPATITILQQAAQPHCPQLRLIGSNAPVNQETWHWLYDVLGQENCPVLTTWQQPETGSIALTSLPSMPLKPSSAGLGVPGLETAVVNDRGDTVSFGQNGRLVFKTPWPAMFRTIVNNPGKYIEQYWHTFAEQGWYATSQQARQDEDGYFWLEE